MKGANFWLFHGLLGYMVGTSEYLGSKRDCGFVAFSDLAVFFFPSHGHGSLLGLLSYPVVFSFSRPGDRRF